MPAGVPYDVYQIEAKATSWSYVAEASSIAMLVAGREDVAYERINISPNGFSRNRISRNPIFILNHNISTTGIGQISSFRIENDGLYFIANIGGYTYYEAEITDKIDAILSGTRQFISIGIRLFSTIRFGEEETYVNEEGKRFGLINSYIDEWQLQEISSVLSPRDLSARIINISKNI